LATVRIYKVAELLGTTSQEVTALLKRDHGIEVKSASGTIEEVVARQFVDRLARQRNIALPGGDIAGTDFDAFLRGLKAMFPWLPGDLATPLAVVLNELMQNAVDHAFTASDGSEIAGRTKGNITVQLARSESTLVVDVVDDGVGLPPGFSVEQSGGLGLSIVHTLVTSELGGTIELRSDRGTRVHLTVPVRKPGSGTL